ncbi:MULTISPECIES: class I SAM-dependent methyltransferase [unclassified Modestobacter]|uniref:class I SAM-dependent methyltransferase n=1 Tax=unclassified Modestobacter TaxID=2643866 RepID=UPI0022AACB32|nr:MULTISPECIES: class I SAM-dependent methyltransferase [unclassified Modestobacter]MCZ2824335.1 class I SAM-dependent methyltransferase [Modestobacter sp. VKM Ac-2981]MCZ2854137.1 class I SAM-dependent methyltransferase [Modestobacter sp. VKM Ac-2982]
MPVAASTRLVWAARVADPGPGERVLEVGFGHGVLLSLLAARLTSGSVLGLDRSATMTAAAAARNAAAVGAGTVRLQTAALTDADLPDAAFDLVVAVHVGAFWRPPAAEHAVVRRVLAEGGRFLLVDQPLQQGATRSRVDQVAGLAAPHGLTVAAVHTGATPPRPSIAVELRPGPG